MLLLTHLQVLSYKQNDNRPIPITHLIDKFYLSIIRHVCGQQVKLIVDRPGDAIVADFQAY